MFNLHFGFGVNKVADYQGFEGSLLVVSFFCFLFLFPVSFFGFPPHVPPSPSSVFIPLSFSFSRSFFLFRCPTGLVDFR